MGIDLEALANDLRAAGYFASDGGEPLSVGINTHERFVNLCRVFLDGHVYWSNNVPLDWGAANIIARHLGAGQPVAVDRAALRHAVAYALCPPEASFCRERVIEEGDVDDILAAVESAGWGPRAELVAPPEPLSAGELDALNDAFCEEFEKYGSGFIDGVRAVLAALPARFAVPVEGAR